MKKITLRQLNTGVLRRRRTAEAGFSLVEVLVAIALLTIGIVAFLQLFPIGFFTLSIAANSSAANRLAQAELERLTGSNGNGAQIQEIAAVTTEYDPISGLLTTNPTYNADANLFVAHSVLGPTNDVNGARYVKGEVVRIPAPTTTATTSSSNVLLDFGPVEVPAGYTFTTPAAYTSTANTPVTYDPTKNVVFYVHGTPWARQIGVSTSATSGVLGTSTTGVAATDPEVELAQDSPSYLIDYTNKALAVREPTGLYNQAFTLRYFDTAPAVNSVQTVTFVCNWSGTPSVPNCWDPNYHKPLWFSLASIGITDPIQPGSDVLYRDFQYISSGSAFGSDPYQYTIPTSSQVSSNVNISGYASFDTYLGEIAFNPLAGQIRDARGEPIQASVDYLVNDWHIIHEDRTVGALSGSTVYGNAGGGSSVLRLTLNHLLQSGSNTSDGAQYAGIAHGGSPLLVYDLDTFAPLAAGTDYTVNYDTGTVTVLNKPQGTHLRIFYMPANDWGVTTIKPAAVYTQDPNTGDTTPAADGEFVATSTSSKITFPATDANEQVQITATMTFLNTLTSQTQTVSVHEMDQIGTTGAPFVDLTDSNHASLIPANCTFQSMTVSSVLGASLTVRTVYRERGDWRNRDITTVDLPSTT